MGLQDDQQDGVARWVPDAAVRLGQIGAKALVYLLLQSSYLAKICIIKQFIKY